MKTKSLIASAILVFGLSAPAFADDTQALAEQYVNMPEIQQMMTDMFSPESMANQVAASLPANIQLTDSQKQRIGTLMSDAMNDLRPKMTALMIKGSAETFTTDELTALIDFYSSEHGAAIMAKMQPFMQRTMAELAADMQKIQMEITPELVKILQEKS
ncbi:DUF2059 domain-containing protein [Ruegeria sp. HKCCD8929]|uniref:DUF2059 domain-containing protein n=1 Tax=Ruegeria sp. HKCCD8929 TaxID=2683006 RepID=UPI001488C6DA|nr:DUF2059 domain-containing protein [Ruegeria sp. HKCCD8929]